MFMPSSHIDFVPYSVEFNVFPRLQSFFLPSQKFQILGLVGKLSLKDRELSKLLVGKS